MRPLVIQSVTLLLALILVGCAPNADGTFSSGHSNSTTTGATESDAVGIQLLTGEQASVVGSATNPLTTSGFSDRLELPSQRERTIENRLGTKFHDSSIRWQQSPKFTEISIPEISNRYAIWGATGRDDFGNLYLGVSCRGDWKDSASLCRISVGELNATEIGDAVTNLRRLEMASDATMQMKIHSKPVQADDGYLYFASMDEYGETEDGTRLPFYGSNLWRIPVGVAGADPSEGEWEHLLALPEGVVATACTGRYVYALGYYQHTLYQFDTENSGVRKIQVGSSGGHVSRNFLVDLQEHVYVPRVVLRGTGDYVVQLIEFDTDLREIASHPIDDYGATSGFDSHGIVGFAFLKTGDCIFTTAKGAMYHLKPAVDAASNLERLGWFHPSGESYPSVLCSPDGESIICGLTQLQGGFEWVVYNLDQWRGEVLPLSPSAKGLLQRKAVLAYGSNTRDQDGDAIVAGWYQDENSGKHLPYAARIQWPSL